MSTPRPLLITGGKGSGKTSIAKAVSAILEADRDVLTGELDGTVDRARSSQPETIYHDVARLDGEGRVKELKAKIEAWFEGARKRRPALLVLDGLDSLLSPEHEVSQLIAVYRTQQLSFKLTPSSQPTILAELFCRLANPGEMEGIMVIATASSTSALHPLISIKHVFGETIKIAPLTKERRRDVSLCPSIQLNSDTSKTGRGRADRRAHRQRRCCKTGLCHAGEQD